MTLPDDLRPPPTSPAISDPANYIFCGSDKPPTLMSSGNKMAVVFSSTSETEKIKRPDDGFGGFRFRIKYSYTTACKFTYRSEPNLDHGSFSSPNFPGLYPLNTRCHYQFIGQPDERVVIRFEYFDIDGLPNRYI
ncbi:hypothetical protein HELRODRAFT_174798 [Helobdella robusta]|uniref:CUB domain-containing protein n=1 Tax=Helobdella robusta TaxID=6412 RepID=T1F8H6_HELRO|nr:hypothetical protein HELRODRAFT_174798 [Helobdella robusta]ESO01251.1 hypothetical protein HELRODRAFT_174798 [Helobdella robusta]